MMISQVYRGPIAFYKFITDMLVEEHYCKKTFNENFNRYLKMSKRIWRYLKKKLSATSMEKNKQNDIPVRDQ